MTEIHTPLSSSQYRQHFTTVIQNGAAMPLHKRGYTVLPQHQFIHSKFPLNSTVPGALPTTVNVYPCGLPISCCLVCVQKVRGVVDNGMTQRQGLSCLQGIPQTVIMKSREHEANCKRLKCISSAHQLTPPSPFPLFFPLWFHITFLLCLDNIEHIIQIMLCWNEIKISNHYISQMKKTGQPVKNVGELLFFTL